MVQAVEYMDRVAKGASVLTEFDKDWPRRVNLKRLNIDSIEACVVVQVVTDCDGFNEAIEWLALQERGWATNYLGPWDAGGAGCARRDSGALSGNPYGRGGCDP